jgi:hypothetical protein
MIDIMYDIIIYKIVHLKYTYTFFVYILNGLPEDVRREPVKNIFNIK